MAFNPVPSEVIHETLEKAGFSKGVQGKEVFFERANHHLPCLKIRVYTSAKVGSSSVVECGKDAIRTVLLYTDKTGKTRCVKKGKRVYRTGSTADILARMLDRARELYALANWIYTAPSCKSCGAPCYHDTKKCVAYCWKNKKP